MLFATTNPSTRTARRRQDGEDANTGQRGCRRLGARQVGFLVGCDSPIDLQAVALVGERSRRRGGHIQRMRLLVESDGFRLRGHYCHSGGLWMLQIGSAGASRHEREAAINWAQASGGSGGVTEMRATGIVGQARCDNGARPAGFGRVCARGGVSWQKVGSNTGCRMRDDVDDKKSNQTVQVMHEIESEVVDGENGGLRRCVFFCLRLVIAWRGAGLGMRDATGGAEEERKAENQKCKSQRAKR